MEWNKTLWCIYTVTWLLLAKCCASCLFCLGGWALVCRRRMKTFPPPRRLLNNVKGDCPTWWAQLEPIDLNPLVLAGVTGTAEKIIIVMINRISRAHQLSRNLLVNVWSSQSTAIPCQSSTLISDSTTQIGKWRTTSFFSVCEIQRKCFKTAEKIQEKK